MIMRSNKGIAPLAQISLVMGVFTDFSPLKCMTSLQERPTAGKFCSPCVLLGKQYAPDCISGVRISNSRDPRSTVSRTEGTRCVRGADRDPPHGYRRERTAPTRL